MIPINRGPAHSIPEYCIGRSSGDSCIRCLCETVDTISLSTAIVTESRNKIHASAPDLLA